MPATELQQRILNMKPDERPACLVYVRNLTPGNRRAQIVAAGVHFFSDDPTSPKDYLVGPVRGFVAPGEGLPFVMNDPRFVVRRVQACALVRIGDDDLLYPQTEFAVTLEHTANAGEQIIELNLGLRVASRASSQLNTAEGGYVLTIEPQGA